MKKTDNYQDYINLSPTSNASDIEEYSEILNYSLTNKDIHNIAIFGNYGAGKSSFLRTYFNDKKNYINISLGSYGKEKKDIGKRKIEEYHQTIEKSILQQLLYQTEQEKVPQSRFKRLTKYSKIGMFLKTLLFVLFSLISLFVFIPNFFDKFFGPFNNISDNINNWNFKIKSLNIPINYIVSSIVYLLIFLFIIFLIYKVCEFIKDNFYISKLKFKDTEIEINGKTESIFNKYLDEIIYFFQCSNYNVVIFEDIDRFNEAIFIIEKLKELNYLLNTSSKVKREIKFIYAIKDDFFENTTERTKFFDKTIPIIPVSSLSNSNEIIWDKFKKIYGDSDNQMYYEIDKKFINNISVFVDDMRTINNIMADFVLFSDKFIQKSLDNCKLMSMMFYKNLYPQKYALLLKGEGILPNVLRNKNSVVEELTKKLKLDKTNILEEIENIKNDKLINLIELKQVFIMNLVKISNDNNINNIQLKINNVGYNVVDFLKEDFDINMLKEDIIYKNQNYPYNELNEEQIFENFGNKELFIQRLDRLNIGKEASITKKLKEVILLEKEIKSINQMSIKELISKYGIVHFSDELNDFELFILKRGFISNDYYDYITLFKEGNLTIQDMQFVKNVKKDNKMDSYSYRLENLDEIVNRLDIFDYSSTSIYNFDLFDYIFNESNGVSSDVKNKILEQFQNITDEKLDFVDSYLENSELSKKFIKSLLLEKNNLWEKCYLKNSDNSDYIDGWLKIILSNQKFLLNTDDSFVAYINSHDKFYKVYSLLENNHKESLISLKVRFKNIDNNCSKDFIDFLLENNLYDINENMLKLILLNTLNSCENYFDRFLTILEDENLTLMKKNIYNNFEAYINNIYINLDKQNNDENIILNIINNDNIKDEIKSKVIAKETVKLKDLNKISTNYYKCVFDNDLFEHNWKNIIYLYNYEQEISLELANIINNIGCIENIKLLNNKKDFLIELVNNENIDSKTIEKNIEFLDFKILDLVEIDYKYNFDKLKLIVENDKIEFNSINFNYIKDKSLELLIIFIKINKQNYIDNINDFDVKDIANKLIDNTEFEDDIKSSLFKTKTVDISMIDINSLYNLVLKDKYELRNEESFKELFNSNIDSKKKFYCLNSIKEEIGIDKIKEYLSNIDIKLNDIAIGKNNFSVSYDESLFQILEKLKEKRIISSYRKTLNNKIMIYNRKK